MPGYQQKACSPAGTGYLTLKTGLITQNSVGCAHQSCRLGRRPNRNAQAVLYLREIEPADEDFLLAQPVLPLMRRETQGLDEDEIGLAREHPEAQLRQLAA